MLHKIHYMIGNKVMCHLQALEIHQQKRKACGLVPP